MIPRSTNNRECIRTLDEIIAKDKGGMIFSPKIGLHENVVELDYENEYANLILKHNLSYETVTSTEDGRIMQNGKNKPDLLPTVLENVLNRRLFFKNLQKSSLINTNEWFCCEQRIVALKNILVSLYGTTGSFWNRFANITTFEEINRLSREVLTICNKISFALVNSCDTLVNSDNTLSFSGTHARDCIRNGALLAGGALLLGVDPGTIVTSLPIAAKLGGCDNVVNFSVLSICHPWGCDTDYNWN